MLAIGKILKAHGIRGEVKIESFLDSPDCFANVKNIFIDNNHFEIDYFSVIKGDFLYVKFKEISDMTQANLFVGKTLYCDLTDLPKLEEGSFYINEIIGCKVFDGKNEYGRIKSVLQYGSSDVMVCEKLGKKIMFPWVKALEAKVDVDAKLFIVNAERLAEVIVYED